MHARRSVYVCMCVLSFDECLFAIQNAWLWVTIAVPDCYDGERSIRVKRDSEELLQREGDV